MRVKAVVSFSDSNHGSHGAGEEFDLPEGVDWLKAGLVVPAEQPKPAKPEQAPKE